MNNGPRNAAFFDVDETLITVKSMFDFLRYWTSRGGDRGEGYERAVAGLHNIARQGGNRSEVNRAYYRWFTGVARDDLWAAGAEWYTNYRQRPTAFVGTAVRALAAHRAAGDVIVLVSGSFRACLDPLAEDIGADLVLCTEPVVGADDRLTGEIERTMIGSGKAAAVTATIARLGLAAERCSAYGDHTSDLDMLSSVGRPCVVGEDAVLAVHAHAHGWPRWHATPVPHWSAVAA